MFRNNQQVGESRQPFQWVAVLFIIAVLLPTVCLLWFMNQAVKNERLAVRQKLVDTYRVALEDQLKTTDQSWLESMDVVEQLINPSVTDFIDQLSSVDRSASIVPAGVLVYNRDYQQLFPPNENRKAESVQINNTRPIFKQAWRAEFIDKDMTRAIAAYEEILAHYSDESVLLQAHVAISRCLSKANRLKESIERTKIPLADTSKYNSDESEKLLLNIHISLVSSINQIGGEGLAKEVEALVDRTEQLVQNKRIPLESRTSLAQHTATLVEKVASGTALEKLVAIQQSILLESKSVACAKYLDAATILPAWKSKALYKIPGIPKTFGILLETDSHMVVLLLDDRALNQFLSKSLETPFFNELCVRVLDNDNLAIFSSKDERREILFSTLFSQWFPGWSISLYPADDTVFQQAAGRQAALYIWTASMVIILMMFAGSISVYAVIRQLRLNRLKNDFIATVTHELKTPLATMRVLVDTLFEGHYEYAPKVGEYLKMISQENLRLTRLIENFLTFSRMERNKQVFDIVGNDVQSLVQAAVTAVQPRLDQCGCNFKQQISENLSPVLADRDALIMALTNLLDNAIKYSPAPCKIKLSVSEQSGQIHFTVQDNGVGIPMRAQRRIFEKFYQTDQRLSRSAEGCGLGLSIVKFIVDAHNGSVGVESTQGQGSTFMLRIPIA